MSDITSTHEVAEATKAGGLQADPSVPLALPADAEAAVEGRPDEPRQVMPDGR